MTTVGFDALIYAFPAGGMATYQSGLMGALRRRREVEIAFSGGLTGDPALAVLPGLRLSRVGQRHLLFARNMARAMGLKSDVHHLTSFWRAPGLRTKRTVLSIHDMIPERFGAVFEGIKGSHYGKARLAAKADAIVCGSEASRRDVIELLGLPEERVFVTPYGGPAIVAPEACTTFEAKAGRYVLIVGRRGHYKNFLGVLPSLGAALVRHDLTLVCVGGGPFTAEERAALAAAGLSDRAEQVGLSAGELAAAYAHALCLIAPSLAEGFGFPVLEAMAHGAPVLASDIPVQREVGGEAALWWEAQRPEALAAALDRLVDDAVLRTALSEAGRARAALFSWDETARRTEEIYRRVV